MLKFIHVVLSTFFFTDLTTCLAFDFDTKTSRNTSKNVINIDPPIYSIELILYIIIPFKIK